MNTVDLLACLDREGRIKLGAALLTAKSPFCRVVGKTLVDFCDYHLPPPNDGPTVQDCAERLHWTPKASGVEP